MKSLRYFLVAAIMMLNAQPMHAQYEGFKHEGEFGVMLGAAHYFGDLNTRAQLNRPKVAGGIFFRKQFNNYVAARVAANFAMLGYSDVYNTKNEYQQRRNLSFNTNVWEFMVQADVNFFKFNPVNPLERFTPYLTVGVGMLNFDPYAYLNGVKYFLRPLGTEGQGSALYPERRFYSTAAMVIPLGIGVKYAINPQTNISFEIAHRFTNTDYLDDVSGTYAGAAAFPFVNGQPTPAFLLQDRSFETGIPIGTAGAQRGFSGQKDQYVFATLGISFNISSYRCPSAR